MISHDLGVVFNVCDDIAVMYSGAIVELSQAQELFNSPKHPYTKALLASILPDIAHSISGQPPALTEIISGCKFHTRCKYKTAICAEKIPEISSVGEFHQVSCFNWQDIN